MSFLTRSHALDEGLRVRLRLATRRDAACVRELLERRGLVADDLDLHRLLSYDPRRRAVLCAFAFVGGAEELVGIGAIDLTPGALPDTLVADEICVDGLTRLLGDLLLERATRRGRRAA